MARKLYDIRLSGYVGGWDFDESYVEYILGKKADEEVNVLISSLGGSVASALRICSLFYEHGNVNVHLSGMNASAATIASLGAKHITIDNFGMYLVHKASSAVTTWRSMNADELRDYIKNLSKSAHDLDKIDENISLMYAQHCKKAQADLLDLMKEGAWLSAKDAKDWGFVDEIETYEDDKQVTVTNQIVQDLVENNIPIPENFSPAEQGFFERLTAKINQIFSRKPMKKVFTSICALLVLQDITLEDKKATLTEEQLDTIEADLTKKSADITDLQNQISSKDTTIADLKSQVNALKQQPADETKKVVDDAKRDTSVDEEFVETVNSATTLFNSLP